MKISSSILSNNYKPEELIKKFNNTKVDYMHIDVMDGKFVDNKSYTISDIKKFNDLSTKKLDVHLMVKNPEKYIEDLSVLNVEYITFHYEAIKDITNLIDEIKSCGIKAGISINPDTEASAVYPYLNNLDMVLVMTVNPGRSGQGFIEEVLTKISELKSYINDNGYKTIISVDGGVNEETSAILRDLGVDMLVSASYIQGEDTEEKVKFLKEL